MDNNKLLLKDQLFNKENVTYLSFLIKNVYPKFDSVQFEKEVLKKFPVLELKERIFWIRENIEKLLPDDYEETLDVLLKSLEKELGKEDFIFASFSDYVSTNGCNSKDLHKSLNALGEFTKFFSAEFAIRSFINEFPEESFLKMLDWSKSKNIHQRRLSSEGLRPKLPWAKSINFDYIKGLKVLDNLFYDKERYVTRSVANHMNDISKIDPDYTVELLEKWKDSKKQNEKEMNYIIAHSLRTSVKKGHKRTLHFLGYNSNPDITVRNMKIEKEHIVLGEALVFSFEISAKKNENLVVDYMITYPTPFKKRSEKVFKIKVLKMRKGETQSIEKKHRFKKMTTKKLYSGDYKLELQINGEKKDSRSFYLEV